jgi:hypothetical protein
MYNRSISEKLENFDSQKSLSIAIFIFSVFYVIAFPFMADYKEGNNGTFNSWVLHILFVSFFFFASVSAVIK